MKHTNPAVFPILSFVSVQFSRSVVSDSLWPHGMQHARPPCPSPTPGACSNSCPSSRWCHSTISSSVVSFSSCLQSFAASGSQVSQFFSAGGQSIGASVSASVLPDGRTCPEDVLWAGDQSEQFSLWTRVTSGIKTDDKLWKQADWIRLDSFVFCKRLSEICGGCF